MKRWTNLFSNKNFIYLLVSQSLSQVTIQLLNFLFVLKVYNETGSPIATSIVWIFYALPSLIFGPFAATIVDTFDRRKLLMFTNLLQSLLILFLSFSFNRSVFTMYIVVFLYSTLNQLYVPSESVALTEIVKKKSLALANGVFFTTVQISIIIGFLLASLSNSFFGFVNTLYLSALLLFTAFLAVTKLPELRIMGKRSDPGSLVRDFIERIFEGYRYVVSQRSLLYSYLLQIVLNCSLTVVVVNIPVISKEVLRAPGDYGSALIVTPTILGSVIASYYVPRILEKGIRKLSIIYRSLVMMTFLLALITLIFPEIEGQTLRLVVYFGTFIALGACFVGTIIPLQTHIQEFSPEKMRGRILGNLWFLITLINIFPLLFSGIITEIFGVRVLLLLFFAIYLSIAIYIRNNSGIQLRDGVINNFRIS